MRTFSNAGMALGAIAALVLAAGCGGSGGASSSTGTGTLAVRVTDAPFPADCFDAALVAIDRIEIQGPGGWKVIADTPQMIDLLDLTGGISTPAGIAQLPTGRYHQIRLVMASSDAGVLTWASDGSTTSFWVPSGEVKINPKPHILIKKGETTTLFLDFDLASSFVQNPANGGPPASDCAALQADANRIQFKPVVRAVNAQTVVSGLVTDAVTGDGFTGVTVRATDGTTTTSTLTAGGTTAEPEGAYVLLLGPGTWTLTFEAAGRTTETRTVTLDDGERETLDVTISAP